MSLALPAPDFDAKPQQKCTVEEIREVLDHCRQVGMGFGRRMDTYSGGAATQPTGQLGTGRPPAKGSANMTSSEAATTTPFHRE